MATPTWLQRGQTEVGPRERSRLVTITGTMLMLETSWPGCRRCCSFLSPRNLLARLLSLTQFPVHQHPPGQAAIAAASSFLLEISWPGSFLSVRNLRARLHLLLQFPFHQHPPCHCDCSFFSTRYLLASLFEVAVILESGYSHYSSGSLHEPWLQWGTLLVKCLVPLAPVPASRPPECCLPSGFSSCSCSFIRI